MSAWLIVKLVDLELPSKTPDPNIRKYYGYIRDGAQTAGICLWKYQPLPLASIINGKEDQYVSPPRYLFAILFSSEPFQGDPFLMQHARRQMSRPN